jgi:hypothetical protein
MAKLLMIKGGKDMREHRLRVRTTAEMTVCMTPLRKNEIGTLLKKGSVEGNNVCYVRFRRNGAILPMWPNEIEPIYGDL